MGGIDSDKSSARLALRLLLPLLALAFFEPAQAFINRGYSSLEQTRVFNGDFVDILRQGKLRILLTRDFSSASYLPRGRSPLAEQQRIAEEFALSHGLMPELVIVDNFSKLIPALEAGHGDIIVDNLTINDFRLEKIAFSVPVDHVVEQVLVASKDRSVQRVRDLNGKSVMVNRGSTFWHALKWLKEKRYPEIEIVETPDGVQIEQVLDKLAAGEIDATILDSNLVRIYQSYRDDFRVATRFSGQRHIGWGVRKNAPQLVSEINRYLQLELSADEQDRFQSGDFDSIKKRRVLRVLLRNNAASYFLYRGELMGFEYDLAREFADYHGLRLEVVVPPSHRDIPTWLLEGRADIAMSFLEPDDRLARLGDPAESIQDLDHRTIFVRHHSHYWERLSQLQQEGARFKLRATDDAVETEQLIQMVSRGKYKATLADEHLLDIELAKGVSVRSAVALEEEIPHVIAVRKRNPQLKQALDEFITRIYKGEYYNVTYNKYFKSRRSVQRLARGRVVDPLRGQISPYDKLVRKYSSRYGFDWRLVTAQMYQESKFNPKAKSPVGALGLMQLMPRTARSLGIENVGDPASSIRGGVKYLDWLRDRFDASLPISERTWFTLAAYNAGAGHVHDARRLAAQIGLDPDRWFDHTEQAMLLLSKRHYAKKARYGYVNGREPVNYVRDIRQRFEAYIDLSRDVAQIPEDPETAVLSSRDLIRSLDSSLSRLGGDQAGSRG
jgi:membrane-bound lytic murein transglycosylase F